MRFEIFDDELELMRAVGVLDDLTTPPPPRWWTITKITLATIIACAVVLWIGHQADQHLAAALDAGYGR
ncbi:hypothetical protein SEA_BRAN_39 [Corynebacterium phage Bran]|nr:hypothetical protein SEA_BRAN_39 [Corynebacterium phage Bran]